MQLTMLQRQALGFDVSALVSFTQLQQNYLLHKDMLPAWLSLKAAAARAGFDLAIISSYRSFERQALIWNSKASGERVLLDEAGNALDYAALDKPALLKAILRWSAAPGFSRHHWGCDVDVFDANRIKASDVQLVPEEVNSGGACAALHEWLDEQIAANQSSGFFRPYTNKACKVSEEKWHLSYLPIACRYEQAISPQLIKPVWQEQAISLLTDSEQIAEAVYNDYVRLDYRCLPQWAENYVSNNIK